MISLPCAIYTRKSSEEGLEQGFNSLAAQREACEAFVVSQKALGWRAIGTYDDGGFSGGVLSGSASGDRRRRALEGGSGSAGEQSAGASEPIHRCQAEPAHGAGVRRSRDSADALAREEWAAALPVLHPSDWHSRCFEACAEDSGAGVGGCGAGRAGQLVA